MALRFARKTLLAVIEDLYGTEKVPTTAANSIETMDLRISPLEGETENRDIDRQALGNDLTFHTSVMRRLTFKTSLAGGFDISNLKKWQHPKLPKLAGFMLSGTAVKP